MREKKEAEMLIYSPARSQALGWLCTSCWNAGLWRRHDRSALLHRRSVHKAIPHICGAKAIPTSLLLLSSPRNN